MTAFPLAPFTFAHDLRVRWSEVDPQGIVFNPHYFSYADVAFTEYQRAIGLPYPAGLHEAGVDLYAVASSARFHASARYDDVLSIAVRAATLGRTSLAIDVEIARAEERLVSLSLTYVTAGRATQLPEPMPAALREAILSFEGTPPQQKTAP